MKHNLACECCNENFSNNIRELYYNYWLSKCIITNDNNNRIAPIFDTLNFKTMVEGITCFILDFGFKGTIGVPFDIRYDKNHQPISASVLIELSNNASRTIRVVDWKLFDEAYTPRIFKEALISRLGLGSYFYKTDDKGKFLVDKNKKRIKEFKVSQLVFKTIFFKNNLYEAPSLCFLSKIIKNIHELDIRADKDRKTLNLIYAVKSNKKLSPKEIDNFALVIDKNEYGVLITQIDDKKLTIQQQIEFLSSSLSKWPEIKDQSLHWEQEFFDFAGISKEKLKDSGENLSETQARMTRTTAIETEYFKYRKLFINEINNYYNSIIKKQNEDNRLIQKTPLENIVLEYVYSFNFNNSTTNNQERITTNGQLQNIRVQK